MTGDRAVQAARSTSERPLDERHDTSSPARVEALTDGVFAIVLTILVLEISVPPALSEESAFEVGEELRSTFFAWIVSFLITALYWVGHRDLLARVRVVNRDLVWLNLLFLLPVCLIPFAASLLGTYPDEPKAVHVYGIVVIAVTVMRTILYRYVTRRPRLLREHEGDTRPGLALAISAAPIAVYAFAMALADVSTALSISLYFSVPILYFLLLTLLREGRGTRSEAEEFS